jgi:hypothetical protein
MVCARIAVLRDERAVVPIGVHSTKLGVTLSLPSIVGREGCLQVLAPLSNDERIGFEKRVETLQKAQERSSLTVEATTDPAADVERINPCLIEMTSWERDVQRSVHTFIGPDGGLS